VKAMLFKTTRQCLKASLLTTGLLFCDLLQTSERLRFADGTERSLPTFFQKAVDVVAQELKTAPYEVKKFVCRLQDPLQCEGCVGSSVLKFNNYSCPKTDELATDACVWQLGEGPLVDKLPKHYTSGKRVSITTGDGVVVNTIFHEREGADTLIFVAHGFRDNLATFIPVLWLCERASIVFFDFRGHDVNAVPNNVRGKICKKLLDIDASLSCFGCCEEQEVLAVVNHYKKQLSMAPYKKVVGLGFCFGAAMMVKAQVMQPDLFTHLILDSLWPSSELLLQKFLHDPQLVRKPRKNQAGPIASLFSFKIVQKLLQFFSEKILFGKKLDGKVHVCELLKKITVPMLFVYGDEDALITPGEFEMVWNSVCHNQKVALLNNNKHLLSFLKSRELLKVVMTQFINETAAFCREKAISE
jgi:pimeloyl-ACP methyl ester carboxylesterase